MCIRVKHHLIKSKTSSLLNAMPLIVCFCLLFAAFIQSDTILEVLHFDEGRLLQVRLSIIFSVTHSWLLPEHVINPFFFLFIFFCRQSLTLILVYIIIKGKFLLLLHGSISIQH